MIPKPTKRDRAGNTSVWVLRISKAQQLRALSPLWCLFPSFWTTGVPLTSPPLHMPPDIAFCFTTEVLYSGLCLSSRRHQSVLPNPACCQLFATRWLLSKDTFCLLHPQTTFCLCLGSWKDLSVCKMKVHFAPLYPTFKSVFWGAVTQLYCICFCSSMYLKDSQLRRGICNSKPSTDTCAEKTNSLSSPIMLNLIWIAALGTCNYICPSVNKLPFWVVLELIVVNMQSFSLAFLPCPPPSPLFLFSRYN